MSNWCKYCLILAVFLSIPCCRQAPPSPKTAATIAYDDSVYCFNQRSIVSRDGHKGITDLQGKLVLPLEWDSIEFLDDDVALLSRSGLWFLCTRDGRIFAQGSNSSGLEQSFKELFTQLQENDIRYWDSVLDQLESLSSACLSNTKNGISESILSERGKLLQLLGESPGAAMSKTQEKRLEAIVSEFSSLYHR